MSFRGLRAFREKKQAKSLVVVPASSGSVNDDTPSDLPPPPPEKPGFRYDLPASMELKVVPGKGRAIFSTVSSKPGSALFFHRPRVVILSTPNIPRYCSYCCAELVTKRCSACRTVWYCDLACQKWDWALHQSECECLKRVRTLSSDQENPSIPPDAVRCLARISFAKVKYGLNSGTAKELDSLHSLKGALSQSAQTSHAQLAHALVQYLGAEAPTDLKKYGICSAGDLVDLISKFSTNTHTLTTPNLTQIGLAVSPALSLFNHSCEPNAVLVFPGSPRGDKSSPSMQLVCIRDINPGDEIVISYVDTTLPYDRRRAQLKDAYGFDCVCPLCQRSENQLHVDPRAATYCPARCGGIAFLPTPDKPYVECTTCKKRAPTEAEAIGDALRIGQEALDKVTALQDSDPAYAAKIAANIISLLTSAGMTNGSHPLLGLLRSHHYLLTTSLPLSEDHQKLLDDTIRTAVRVLQGLLEVLPFGHPIRAVHFSELGMLCATDETASNIPGRSQPTNEKVFPPTGAARLQLAINYLIEARKELLIAFGIKMEGGDVGKKVRETLIQLEAEMGIWKEGVKTAWKEQVADHPKR
ncbi:SET domain-containing protein [Thelephora ganbajun]|uniref:SET domain-containing protein n=1 Tax=Thelephora ganbajun TaxID=370292 RepID=A0ACB6ZS02_THEGA|nr:SET domain-containing protein [Thelephora ganbajun]